MPSSTKGRSLKPQDFKVNKTWLVFRANRNPLRTSDGDVDVFVLQDAASLYILGNVFAPAGTNAPDADHAASLLRKAWAGRQAWPDKILLAGPMEEASGFERAAEWNGVAVRRVAEREVRYFIEDVRTSYDDFLQRDAKGDA